jgi:riboflavin kinase/FMN adenylyltransferase
MAVLVFEPHPREFFQPDADPFRLTRFERKAKLLEDLGVDLLFALPFDGSMAAMEPYEFVLDVLVAGLQAVHISVGYDFRYGRNRGGDIASLCYMGEMEGYGVSVVDPVRFESTDWAPRGDVLSSSRVRALLREGRPDAAASLLGRWWTVDGKVIEGDQRGRTIGFPTANIGMAGYVQPRLGVYACLIETGEGIFPGVANLGRRPTVHTASDVLLEAHLFDFDGDLYGKAVSVHFVDFLRPEQKFDGLDALKAQIAADAEVARDRLDGKATDTRFDRPRLLKGAETEPA